MKKIRNTVFDAGGGPIILWFGIMPLLLISLVVFLAVYVIRALKNAPDQNDPNQQDNKKNDNV